MKEEEFNAIPESERANRVLTGTFYYAHLHTPDHKSVQRLKEKLGVDSELRYKVQLGLEDAELAKAKAWGLRVKEPTDAIPMEHVEIFRKIKPPATEETVKVPVVDSLQNPIPSDVLIGNGSKGKVKFATYYYKNNGGGVNPAMLKTQILDLVEYDNTDDAFDMEEGGFTVASTPAEDDIPPFEADEPAPKTANALFDD